MQQQRSEVMEARLSPQKFLTFLQLLQHGQLH